MYFLPGDGEYENARSIPESSAVSVSSGDSDHSGNGGGGNRRLLTRNSYHRHGNQTNNAEMDLRGYLGHDVNSSQHYCNRANSPLCEVEFELDPDLDESDENESSNYSGSPVSNGISRIKRKLQHRRFMSSPDTDAGGFPRETLKREPYSEPDFGARYGAKSQMKYQNVAKDVGQRVLQKYRRRASTDIDEMKPPGLKTSEAAIREKLNSGSTTNRRVPDRRQSLPAQTPRKLRPLLARSRPMESMEINSDLGTGSRSLGQTLAIQESSPVVPRRDSFNQSDPLLQVGSKSGNSKRDLKPVRPLRIEVPGTEDIQSVTSDGLSTTPPDSAFLSLPTSPGHIPSVNSHRPFEPARHRFSSDSGVGSRKSSLVHPNDDEAAMAALAAGRDELIANTPPRRASDVQRGEGLMPLGDIGKKPLCQTRSAPNSTVIGQSWEPIVALPCSCFDCDLNFLTVSEQQAGSVLTSVRTRVNIFWRRKEVPQSVRQLRGTRIPVRHANLEFDCWELFLNLRTVRFGNFFGNSQVSLLILGVFPLLRWIRERVSKYVIQNIQNLRLLWGDSTLAEEAILYVL